MFSQAVIENLGFYVYFLKDTRNGEFFYVGKGRGNRIFQHLMGSFQAELANEKSDRIREIRAAGEEVEHYILRHGLTEEQAFEIEAALIDFVGLDSLSNVMGGHYSSDFGIKTVEEIQAQYAAKGFIADDPVILINLNRLYRRDMTAEELYEATRKAWVIGPRRECAKYAIAHYRGLTREVYIIERWYPVPAHGKNRWAFDGHLAPEEIREKYRYQSIKDYFKRGEANPIKYVNC